MKNTLFKKVLAVALACTMTFSMATITHAADAKEITIGVTSFADTLEPTEQYFSWVVSRYAIGECLTKFDENGEIVPCLAESWENSEDGKTWTFKIREGVKFSNGDDMTPEMVMASIQRTADKSDRVPEFFDIDSIEVDGKAMTVPKGVTAADLTMESKQKGKKTLNQYYYQGQFVGYVTVKDTPSPEPAQEAKEMPAEEESEAESTPATAQTDEADTNDTTASEHKSVDEQIREMRTEGISSTVKMLLIIGGAMIVVLIGLLIALYFKDR